MKEIKNKTLHDFKQISHSLGVMEEEIKILKQMMDKLFQDLLSNGNIVFVERRNNEVKQSPKKMP